MMGIRNWFAVAAHFRNSAGGMQRKKEKGREFRSRVREELAQAEQEAVSPNEILDEKAKDELSLLLTKDKGDDNGQ